MGPQRCHALYTSAAQPCLKTLLLDQAPACSALQRFGQTGLEHVCGPAAGVEMFKKQLSEGQAGDNVGLLLRRIQRDDVVRGQVICKPGSVTPHQKFEGEIYALTKEEGGRHTPFFSNYKPQFFFRTADITGALALWLAAIDTHARLQMTTPLGL